jgi:two-component system, LytTR family, response regulator
MKAIIVDDEKGARESLSKMIERNCKQVQVLAKLDSIKSAYDAILQHAPDLVFLDIEMPNGNAFDLLQKFERINFQIIFTTAFDNYAIKAIKYSAIDYLLKPIDPDELVLAIHKLENLQEKNNELDNRFKALLNNIKTDKVKKIGITDSEGLIFVNLNDILYCNSDGNYTVFILTDHRKITSTKSLGEYEQLFSETNFCRIHRSHMVNLDFVKKYIKGEGGYVVMIDDTKIEVSRRNKTDFLQKFSLQ